MEETVNLAEIKQRFPESAGEIELLERLGFASRSDNWLACLEVEQAQTACWLLGKIGDF